MNKSLIAMSVSLILLTTQVYAVGGQTAAMGYVYSQVDEANLSGVNFNHRYEISPDWGIIGSFSWLKGEKIRGYNNEDNSYQPFMDTAKTPAQYYSLLAGPSYQVNHYFSLYGVIGIARLKWDHEFKKDFYLDKSTYQDKNMALTWGTGALISPFENLAFYIGYEETQIKPENENYHINSFNVGAGYHF
ncbi:Ail/Lom family outer membrane beta-barrel protein [Xenorhabdus littoralis]|uniref:Ail/Lom family outer membrane beta-barrel protein n=1 Tax=Xenorhabdus littoralis TaxID=2582835 RepID=UPI0029E7E2FB|nr:Ail/Lom family outer membrane beta-barrel protein [Xenorhabdus sp. psl]MDX7991862.1 TonB-dependent receptor [Xenorhabdus sp. psl]